MKRYYGYYDQGEKCGKLLAWRLKKRAINSIKTPAGVTSEPVEINNTFRDFNESLYASECLDDLESQNSFLDHLKFQTLSENEQELGCCITTNELAEAIQNMQSGKAPGPDGFPIEFYKCFREKLLVPLLAMYKESYTKGILPPSLRLAIIMLSLKFKLILDPLV